ncbi:MAG: transglutaminase-like domain-containing protein [Chloroflexota bacterium]
MSTITIPALAYYRAQTEITDPGEYAVRFDNLPSDLPGLHQIVQNVYIHVWKIRKYHPHLLEGRTHEIESRRVSKSLALTLAHDDRPLTLERPLEKKLIVDCRHFATLLCSMLRYHGIPARVRCGFATYLEKSHYQDHWVTEYWDAGAGRWLLEDPDLKMHDVARNQFITAGDAWQQVRSGKTSDLQFGFSPDMRGAWALRYDVPRDLACLNGFEGLSSDEWGDLMGKPEPTLTTKDRNLFDEAAAWTLVDNSQFSAMRNFYENTPSFRVPRNIKTYNYVIDQNKPVDLDAGG